MLLKNFIERVTFMLDVCINNGGVFIDCTNCNYSKCKQIKMDKGEMYHDPFSDEFCSASAQRIYKEYKENIPNYDGLSGVARERARLEFDIKSQIVKRARLLKDNRDGKISDEKLKSMLFTTDLVLNLYIKQMADITKDKKFFEFLPREIKL